MVDGSTSFYNPEVERRQVMFQRNPIKTEKGIFRRDHHGNWWELEIKALQKRFSHGEDSSKANIPSDVVKNLEGVVVVNDADDESSLIVKGWKKVSAIQRILEIEKSVNSGRTVLELDFI